MQHNNYYIITGGPGVGKTTLLQELGRSGLHCIPEVARRIIQEQMARHGDALPWKNRELYKTLMLEGSSAVYRQADPAIVTFFDRGIPDVLAYAKLAGLTITDTLLSATTLFRYNPVVFILPPWKAIYTTDTERKQSWEEALATFEVMKETYSACGYTLAEVPRLPVAERARFVLEHISPPDLFPH